MHLTKIELTSGNHLWRIGNITLQNLLSKPMENLDYYKINFKMIKSYFHKD